MSQGPPKALRILGIDPGSRFTGYGIIDKHGNKLKYIASGTISTVKEPSLQYRLKKIFDELSALIQEYRPDVGSIEKMFHSVNAQSTLILGHARGVAMLALSMQELEANEYSPNEVKSAVVGAGKASKEQVQAMVQILLNQRRKMSLDESDALGIAICHAHTNQYTKYIQK